MQWNRSNNHASVNCIGALLKNDHGRAIKYYSFFSMGSAWVPSRLRISPSIPGNPKSRDDTEVLCYALQALWCDAETRDDVLALIQESHSERINAANGKNIIPAGDGLLADPVKFGCLP